MSMPERKKVLVAGIYLSDRENLALAISNELSSATHWQVDLCWGAVGSSSPPKELRAKTYIVSAERVAKFELLNRLLAEVPFGDYEHLVITDDDIELPPGFLDDYLDVVTRRRFHLAQPARTHRSYTHLSAEDRFLSLETWPTRAANTDR